MTMEPACLTKYRKVKVSEASVMFYIKRAVKTELILTGGTERFTPIVQCDRIYQGKVIQRCDLLTGIIRGSDNIYYFIRHVLCLYSSYIIWRTIHLLH